MANIPEHHSIPRTSDIHGLPCETTEYLSDQTPHTSAHVADDIAVMFWLHVDDASDECVQLGRRYVSILFCSSFLEHLRQRPRIRHFYVLFF